MKFFTKKSVIRKIIIAIVIVMSFNFSIPQTVQADAGGIFVSPLVALVTVIFDSIQHVLEWSMLGESRSFLKQKGSSKEGAATAVIDISKLSGDGKTLKFDGEIWGMGDYGIPVISYTPEEIFSNRVPALDINFINPSVSGGKEEKHIAAQIQDIIASWYVAIRTLAVVGLLSVLVYLGIRMMLTGIAADRAKYKKMLMDWIVAVCIVFMLHYIMSFALTMSETVTAMLSSDLGKTVTVNVPDGTTFNTNLMGFVRFMIQCTDLEQKLTFLALYIILVIYSVRFTWVYLKRVVNMAFLTLIAPVVALTYPIDKVSDGKAQAFNMWIKEFSFNALLQPLHLLLYTVLVGSALQLAVDNPLYAIVCLGFIMAGEKLLKKMFGFDKASGGTLGSLAAAAGVTSMASKALNTLGHKAPGGGQKGKIRTKDIPEREGRDNDGNSPLSAFRNATADESIGAGMEHDNANTGGGQDPNGAPQGGPGAGTDPNGGPQEPPLPPPSENNEELNQLEGQLAGYDETDPYFMDPAHQDMQRRYQELREEQDRNNRPDDTPPPPPPQTPPQRGYDNPFARPENAPKEESLWDVMKSDTQNALGRGRDRWNTARAYLGKGEEKAENRERLKRNLKNQIGDGVRRRAIGAWKTLPTVGYKAARGTLRTASRIALASAMGGLGLAIGATTGDGEKALSMALGAGGVGWAAGDNLFDASVGKVMKDKSISDTYNAGKYGNTIDARNEKADKEYFKSQKFDNFYEKYYKGQDNPNGGKYTKQQLKDITRSYRKAGITSEKDIRKAIKLENQYRKASPNLSEDKVRAQVQNIVQGYNDMDTQDRRAFTNREARENMIQNLSGLVGSNNQTTEQRRQLAEQVFQGYVDFRNL
ncbi:MAG: hypothetical protein HFJ27_04345 [Clostridia bacterium]|nr:hypothetical protein [Clostridia bacterium]